MSSPTRALALVCLAATVASAAGLLAPTHHSRSLSISSGLRAQAAVAASSGGTPAYPWVTYNYTQILDHFDFANSSATFTQKYLVNDTYYQTGGPVFFYTGNEGPIELFAANTGFMFDIAPQFNALLVFVEHRYYGTSIPFGGNATKVYENPKSWMLDYLTSEQALADYATILPFVLNKYATPSAPVVVFGGSYGGMLAAWFRIRYPWLTVGAIAASAPILQFTNMTQPTVYNAIITRTWTAASEVCAATIAKSWDILSSMSLDDLNKGFRVCEPMTEQSQVQNYLFAWLNNAISYMTMADYPYPASFLGSMPGWPVNYACKFFSGGPSTNEEVVEALRQLANVYYNYTGEGGPCNDLGISGPSTLQDLGGWNYQSCTEMVMPIGQYGMPNDFFWSAPWNLQQDLQSCYQTYGIMPRPGWIATTYGGTKLAGATNIVFSNGDLDPWSGGGVHFNISDQGIWAVTVQNGAHHLDLRHAEPEDPQSVIIVRQFHEYQIARWIQSAAELNSQQ